MAFEPRNKAVIIHYARHLCRHPQHQTAVQCSHMQLLRWWFLSRARAHTLRILMKQRDKLLWGRRSLEDFIFRLLDHLHFSHNDQTLTFEARKCFFVSFLFQCPFAKSKMLFRRDIVHLITFTADLP